MYKVSNDHSSISHGMNLNRIRAISYVSYITGVSVSSHKSTNGINILIKTVSAAEDVIPDSFHCYQLYLEILVLFFSELRYILTRSMQ